MKEDVDKIDNMNKKEAMSVQPIIYALSHYEQKKTSSKKNAEKFFVC